MDFFKIITYFQAPILAVILILYLNRKFKIESNKQILKAYGFGLLAIATLFFFDLIVEALGYDQLKNLKRIGFYSFAIVGFGSQLGIFIVLRYLFLPLKGFNSPLDGIIYGMLIALGFSTIAIPLFDLGLFASQPSQLLLYSLPLASLLFGVILGFFVGMGKFRKNRLIDTLTGLGASSFFMGFYYFGYVTSEKTIMLFYGIGVIFIALLLLIKAININSDGMNRSS